MGDDPSNDAIKKQVRKLFTKLTSDLDPGGFITDLLFEREIIDFEQKSGIEEVTNKEDRCRKLLGHLFKSTSPRAFVFFRESLKREYQGFVDEIDKGIATDISGKYGCLDAKREVLLRCIDCNCLFLADLVAREVMDSEFRQEIAAEKTFLKRNTICLQWLMERLTEANISGFVEALRETEQHHVANLITGNEEGNQPISDIQVRRLNRIKPKLLKNMDSESGLSELLFSKESVSKYDYHDRIMPLKGMYERNDAILEAILRRGEQDLINFTDALIETNQKHVAKYLYEGEVIGIHVSTHPLRPDKDEELVKRIRLLIVEDRNGTTHRNGFRELHDCGAHVIGVEPSHSIVVYVYVNTLEAAVSVLQYMKDGRMKTIMKNLFKSALRGVEKKSLDQSVTKIRMESEDEDICFDFVKTKIQESNLNEFRKLLTLAPKRSSQTAKKDDVGRGTQINPTQQIESSHPPSHGRYHSGRQNQPYTVSDENRAGLDDKYKSSRSFQNEDSDYSVYRGKEPPFDPGYNGVQCDDGSYTGSPRRCQYKGIGFLGNRGKQDTFK